MAEDIDIISDKDLEAPLKLAKNYEQLANEFDAVAASMSLLVKKIETQDMTIADLNSKTKELEKEVEKLEKTNKKAADSQKKYAEATKFAEERTGGMISKVKDLTKQFFTLLATPVGAFLLLLSGALASVSLYFKTTNEGADKFENLMSAIRGIITFLVEKVSDLGKEIVKLFEDGNSLGTVFKFLFDQIINRIAGAIDLFTNLIRIVNILSKYNLKDIITGKLKPEDIEALKKATTDLGKAAISSLTGIGNAADEAANKVAALQTLIDSGRELEDALADNILNKAQSLLDIEKQLFIFNDKGNKTDQERLEALIKAGEISEQQLETDKKLATFKERQFTAELLVKNRIISTDQEANAILKNGITLAQERALLETAFGEDIAKRRQLQADTINLERDFFAEQKKNIAKIVALQKEIEAEAIKRAEIETAARVRVFDEQLKAAKEVSGQEILGLRSNLGMRQDLTKKFNQRIVDETKERLKQQEEAEKEHNKRIAEELKRQEAQRQSIIQASLQSIQLIGNEFFDRRKQKLNEESQLIEERRAKELAGAEGDERQKLAINRKFDREQARIKQKQAQADKQAAIFNILISTAANIAKVAPNPVLIALVAGIGALQAALVQSRPLPKFWKGSEHTPDSFIAGDRGREIVMRNGKGIVADRPTIFTGMEGSKVFTNKQTEEILGNMNDVGSALNYGSRVKTSIISSSIVADRLNESNKLLKRIANKKETSLFVDEDGFNMYSDKMARRNKTLNRYFYGR